jgi:hypothetical protein
VIKVKKVQLVLIILLRVKKEKRVLVVIKDRKVN